jgi:TetR/AcrR family transcriptional regulator, regulator of mycofactocin system
VPRPDIHCHGWVAPILAGVSLREKKKALTRDGIERAALDMFLDRGYERVRLDDICAQAVVSARTFFRYFDSKEDLVLGRLRSHLTQAAELLAARPGGEPVQAALAGVIEHVARDYVAESERELTRLRLVAATPVLRTGLFGVFVAFERLVAEFVATRLGIDPADRTPRLYAAATAGAFRVGLEMWVADEDGVDLPEVIVANAELLTGGLDTDGK